MVAAQPHQRDRDRTTGKHQARAGRLERGQHRRAEGEDHGRGCGHAEALAEEDRILISSGLGGAQTPHGCEDVAEVEGRGDEGGVARGPQQPGIVLGRDESVR
jgi:hypothetical protein